MNSFPSKDEEVVIEDEAPDSSFLDVPMDVSPVVKTPTGRSKTSASLSQTPKPSPLASQSEKSWSTLTPRSLSLGGSQSTASPYSQNTQSPSVSTAGKWTFVWTLKEKMQVYFFFRKNKYYNCISF